MKVFDFIQNNKHLGYIITSPATGMDIFFDERWTFNGDFEKPTFKPSMLVQYPVENP